MKKRIKKRKIVLAIILCICGYWMISCVYDSFQLKHLTSEYHEAVKANDYDVAHESLNILHNKLNNTLPYKNVMDEFDGFEDKLSNYFKAFDYIYGNEVQFLLGDYEGDNVADRIIFLVKEIPHIGRHYQEGLCDYYTAAHEMNEGRDLLTYKTWVDHYNNLCSKILTLSINRKNEELAKQILMCFENNVEVTEGTSGHGVIIDGVRVDGNHGYIKYTTKDKDAAQGMYDDAVKSGAFN